MNTLYIFYINIAFLSKTSGAPLQHSVKNYIIGHTVWPIHNVWQFAILENQISKLNADKLELK